MNEPNSDANKLVELLREKVQLEPWHRRGFYFGFVITWLSGAYWLIAEWLKDPDLGPVRTPLQALCMKLHGAAALLFLLLLGTMMTHVRRGWTVKANRWSGGSMIAVNGTLILTAWLLYYLTSDTWRELSGVVHWVVGLSVLPLIGFHVRCGKSTQIKTLDAPEVTPIPDNQPR